MGLKDIEAFSRLVAALGREDFGEFFFEFFDQRIGIDSCTVFKFGLDHAPSCVLAEGGDGPGGRARTRIARDVAVEYTTEGYRHCPHTRLLSSVAEQPVTRLYDPDALCSRDYRRRFYARPDVDHELLLAERVEGSVFYVGLYRGGGNRFETNALELVSYYASLMLNCLVRHTQFTEALHPRALWTKTTPTRIREMLPTLRETLLRDPGRLTVREAEVCAWIMVGFSAEAISTALGISFDTVKTHRKRAYAKLDIGSQNELFTRYVSATLPVGGSAASRGDLRQRLTA